MAIKLDGRSLAIDEVVKVARNYEVAELSDESKGAVAKCREYVNKKIEEGVVIYGVTTGFGMFSNTVIPPDKTAELQRNLIISHACGMGAPLSTEVVRASMLLRCNALARGNSGIRLLTLQTLLEMLNKNVHPIVPEKGSLGASGDLAPLSHIILVMLGEGEAEYHGEILPGKEAMRRAGIETIELAAKEGLALINGTQVMTAIASLVLHDAVNLSKMADVISAMTVEAQLGIKKAFDYKVHELRNQIGQQKTARNMQRILKDSGLAADTQPDKVQDAYTTRCIPQIHGATKDALDYAYNIVSREVNAVTDNPLIFPDEDEVISGGNFHGQPIALAMDFVGIAVAELANVSERRIERLVNPQLAGLPAFLTKYGGVCSGFMIAQYTAASIVSENKVYAHPASVDSIPTSANQEDHVSMGTTAARKARMILDNVQKVLAIELFTASQALLFRDETKLSSVTASVYEMLRKEIPPIEQDIIMYEPMEKCDLMIKEHRVLQCAEMVCGELE
jgi:histidine ammonia-lyase